MVKIINPNRTVLKLYESFKDDSEYDSSTCFSYSKLKDLHDNPEILTEEKIQTDKEWLTFGTMVDLMLTEPEEVDKKIFVNNTVPSPQYKAIASYILDNRISIDDLPDDLVEKIYTESGSNVNWKIETKRQKLIENCEEYITLLRENEGKIIVTTEQFLEAQKIAEVFRTHKWTKEYFMSEDDQLDNNIEIFYHYKIRYTYEGIQCKSELDILFVDHDQMIVRPVDIKTGNDTPRNFINHALYKYKYGYQGGLYKTGIEKFLAKIPGFQDYLVENFRFIYVSRQKPTFPITLEMTDRCLQEFMEEGIYNLMYDIPPLCNVVEEAMYYIDKINEGEKPTIPYEIDKANGLIFLEKLKDFEYANL